MRIVLKIISPKIPVYFNNLTFWIIVKRSWGWNNLPKLKGFRPYVLSANPAMGNFSFRLFGTYKIKYH